MTTKTINVPSQLHRPQLLARCKSRLTAFHHTAQCCSIVLVLLAAALLQDTQLIDSRFTFLLYFVSMSESDITTFATLPVSTLNSAHLLVLHDNDHG